MTMFKFEFKTITGSMIKYILTSSLLALLFISIYPSFKDEIASFITYLPKEFVNALNLKMLTSVEGYYSYAISYVSFVFALQASYYGILNYVKENNQRTAEFLFSRPISHVNIIFTKTSVYLLAIILSWISYTIISFIFLEITNANVSVNIFLLLNISMLLTSLMFFSLAMLLASIYSKISNIFSVSLIIVASMYLVKIIQQALETTKFKYLSFFEYFNNSDLIINKSFNNIDIVLSILIIIFGFIFSILVFSKKDVV